MEISEMTDQRPLSDPERAAEVCREMARLERESYDAWLERTVREAKEREKASKKEEPKG
jgi:hypothetical protein